MIGSYGKKKGNTKRFDRRIEVKLPALSGNYARQTDQPTDRTSNKQAKNILKLLRIFFTAKCLSFLMRRMYPLHTKRSETGSTSQVRYIYVYIYIDSNINIHKY